MRARPFDVVALVLMICGAAAGAEPTPTPDQCGGPCDGRQCIAVCPHGSLDYAGSCQRTADGCECVPFECLAENYCRIAEKREPQCCGNGEVEYQFEECDDGNRYGGDGCTPSCRRETVVGARVSGLLVPAFPVPPFLFGLGYARYPLTGETVFARGTGGGATVEVSVRSFWADPLIQDSAVICLAAKAPPDQPFGPGNVGVGTVGRYTGERLSVTLFLAQWLSAASELGPDEVPCTEDDPGYLNAEPLQASLQLQLGEQRECTGDRNGDGLVTVEEIVHAVNDALNGCGAPTPTPTVCPFECVGGCCDFGGERPCFDLIHGDNHAICVYTDHGNAVGCCGGSRCNASTGRCE